MIFEALQSQLIRFKFHSLGSKLQKISEFNLIIPKWRISNFSIQNIAYKSYRFCDSFNILFIYMIIAYDFNLSLDGLCQGCQSVGTSCFLSCNRYSECILIILYTVHWLSGYVFCQFIKPIASLSFQCTTFNLPEIEIWMFKVIWESNWCSQFFQTVRSLE